MSRPKTRPAISIRQILLSAALLGLYAGFVALVADAVGAASSARPRGVGFGISMWYGYLLLCLLGAVTLALPARLRPLLSAAIVLAGGALILALTFPGVTPGTSPYYAMLGSALALNGVFLIVRQVIARRPN